MEKALIWDKQEDKQAKVIDAARMYYELDYSQQEIAKRLGVSRPTVSRLLQLAKEEGIVQIRIVDPKKNSGITARRLEERFGLKKAVVVPVPDEEEAVIKRYLGEAAAGYLWDTVQDGDIIATTWGTTLYQVAVHLRPKHVRDVKVVQLNGGVSHSETDTYAHQIVQLFGKAFQTSPYFIPLPAIVDHAVVKHAIEADRHIRNILELGQRANIAMVTVGAPTDDSVLIKANYFTEADLAVIYERGAGDICSRYIDVDGVLCSRELDNRTIGITLDELKKKEQSILVAGGISKVNAVYGALKGRYTNVLVTDQYTADSLLKREEQAAVR
ncbi:sugar-binding transcriptional regulator [Paenibacillus sambharensis]